MPINSLKNLDLSDKHHRFTGEAQKFRDEEKKIKAGGLFLRAQQQIIKATAFRKPTSGIFLLPIFGARVELNFGPAKTLGSLRSYDGCCN